MENKTQDNWILIGLLKLCLIGWAVVMYAKTSEVLTALAPANLFGQTGLSVLYGMGTAILIEGVAVILALLPSTHTNRNATIYTIVLFAISGFCQFLDSSLVKDVATRSETEQFFAFAALGIPSIGFGGLLLLLWTLNNDFNAARAGKSTRKPFRGIRTIIREFLDGTDGKNAPAQPQTQVYAEDEKQEELEETSEGKLTMRPRKNSQ